MARTLRYAVVTFIVSLPLGLGACGASQTATTKPDSGTSSTPGASSNPQDSGGVTQPREAGGNAAPQSQKSLDALTAFAGCMRGQGVEIRDPDPDDPLAILHSLDQSDPAVASALPACQDKLAALNGGG